MIRSSFDMRSYLTAFLISLTLIPSRIHGLTIEERQTSGCTCAGLSVIRSWRTKCSRSIYREGRSYSATILRNSINKALAGGAGSAEQPIAIKSAHLFSCLKGLSPRVP